jgi:hypothetical protein
MKTLDQGYQRLEHVIASSKPMGMLFTTNATGLFDIYLNSIHPRHRQTYNCRCCRRFLEKYGTLVTISPEGKTNPAFIPSIPGNNAFSIASQAMHQIVSRAKVTGVFYSMDRTLGDAKSGGWSHLHCSNPCRVVESLLTMDQATAQKTEDFGMLKRAMEEYSLDDATQAVRVLSADVVNGSEKALHIAEWFMNVHQATASARSKRAKDNVLWFAVSCAPAGYCHIKTTMIHTLMDDVRSGLPLDALRRKWNEKMSPVKYKRPTAVKDGNLARANAIFEKLRADRSLERRFATIQDITNRIWEAGIRRSIGPFDRLRTTPPPQLILPRTISDDTLRSVVLPNAETLEVEVPQRGPFFALTAPLHPNAPSLFQWRNGIGWYFYHEGSAASRWGLKPGSMAQVRLAIQKPCHWDGVMRHHTDPTLLVIDGMRDRQYSKGGLFFPDFLRSEFHEIRSSIESYSNNTSLLSMPYPACGIEVVSGMKIRVNGQDIYHIQ